MFQVPEVQSFESTRMWMQSGSPSTAVEYSARMMTMQDIRGKHAWDGSIGEFLNAWLSGRSAIVVGVADG